MSRIIVAGVAGLAMLFTAGLSSAQAGDCGGRTGLLSRLKASKAAECCGEVEPVCEPVCEPAPTCGGDSCGGGGLFSRLKKSKCGGEVDSCSGRTGLLAKLRARKADSCCGEPEPVCCEPAPTCCEEPAPSCGCEEPAPSCGCEAPAPSCGCEVAAAPSCGCEEPAPSCGCEAPAPSCGCEVAAAPSCGCGDVVTASCDSCGSAPVSSGCSSCSQTMDSGTIIESSSPVVAPPAPVAETAEPPAA